MLGRMETLGFNLRNEAHVRMLTEDVVQSSDIEGEKLDTEQVRESHEVLDRILAMLTRIVDRHANPKLCFTAYRRTPVRLACRAVSDRLQRAAQNPHRDLAG